MELLLSTASLYNFDLSRTFRLAAEAGFHGIELMVTTDENTQSIPYVGEISERYGVPVRSVHAPFLLAAKKVWGDPEEKIERSVAMAGALGAEVVVIHLPYFWQWGYARWVRRRLNDCARRGAVTVAIENAILVKLLRTYNFSFFNTLEELKRFDNLVFDTSHYAISGVDIMLAWGELKDKVRHIHLSNNYLRGYDDHALPFEGRLPLDRFLGALRRDGYAGRVALELGPGPLEARLGEERILNNLRRSLEYCLRCYWEGGDQPA